MYKPAFCRRKVSAQRLLEVAQMHFSRGKYLHRGFLWKRRCILSEGSICTEASCGSADAFFRMEASAPRLFGAAKMHFVEWKYLHRGILWKRRCIFPERSICTEAFWSSEDTFCRRKVSAQRLLVEAKMHFVRGKYLHRGILWKRRYILSEGSICTVVFWSSEDAFCQRKVSAQWLLEAAQMHFSGERHLQKDSKNK